MRAESSGLKLGLAVLLTVLGPLEAVRPANAADLQSLSMREAVELSLGRDPGLREARTTVRQKQVELEQAHYAQKSEEEKAAGLFAKPRNLSQQLQTRMKVPQAQMQLTVAREQLRQKTVEAGNETEKAYLQVYQAAQAEEKARAGWDEAQKRLDAVRQKLKYGLAKQTDREAAEQGLEQAASAYKQAQLSVKGTRLALGAKVGVSLERPFAMTFEPVYADLSERTLPGYIAKALETNTALIQDVQSRRLADENLNVTRNLYSSKFGAGRMKALDRMFGGPDIDMDLFAAQYEGLLEQVRQDWEGYYWILLPIPKKLFQGEFDGLRYLDDLRNGLPLAAMEQGKAAQKEKESRAGVIAAVRQTYLDAKGAEEAYAQALRNRDAAADALGKAESKRKLGLSPEEELDGAKEAFAASDALVLSAQIAYRGAIGKLNTDTGGAVEGTYRQGVLPYEQIDDGLSPVAPLPDKRSSGKWTVRPAVGELLSEFEPSPDKRLQATEYALFDANGAIIGGRTKAGKPLRLLSLYVAQPERLKLVLYRGDDTIGEAQLEGSASLGTFTLKPVTAGAPAATSGKPESAAVLIGTVQIALNALTPQLYNAAAASVKESGQGILYSADGKVWFDTERLTDASALSDPTGGAALTAEQRAKVRVTMEVSGEEGLRSLLTAAELEQQLAALGKQVEQLEADKKEAADNGKAGLLAGLATQIEDAKARIAMLKAVKDGDAGAALKNMTLINNPEALLAKLAEENAGNGGGTKGGNGGGKDGGGGSGPGTPSGSGPGAGESSGTGSGADPGPGTSAGSGPGAADADELQRLADKRHAELQAAIAAGNGAAALQAVEAWLEANGKAVDAGNGTTEGLAVLAQAAAAVKTELGKAVQSGDAPKAESLSGTLHSMNAAAGQLAIEQLFAELESVETLLNEVAAGTAPPGTAAAEAQAQIADLLERQRTELLRQAVAKQKEAYSEAELQALGQLAEQLKAEAGEGSEALPPPHLLSPTVSVKLAAPPMLLDGQAFIPLRAVSESFGAAVDWDGATMTATVSTGYGTAECTIGSVLAYVDGAPVALDTPPQLLAGFTYVPLRFLAEAIGLQVVWNDKTGTIELY
ncbi:stalk domain-containing protein [Paenibacillus hodogayensis]|uniref:Stalk domain-containing protein n=1 Tax=Paenibacillus hodogayensis TaxID=279208 RepID=A0ABV5W5E1_9BACL